MSRKNGFTLIELLVVISIIALLLSILMPSLSKAKDSAKRIVCQSNLKQWSLCFSLYVNDYGSYGESWIYPIPPGNPPNPPGSQGRMWMGELGPYYDGNDDLRTCPAASKPRPDMEQLVKTRDLVGTEGIGRTSKAWIYPWTHHWDEWIERGDLCSYTRNGWVANPRRELEFVNNTLDTKNNWRRPETIRGAANVPVLLDGAWIVVWPFDNQPPPEYEDLFLWGMDLFCIDRHGKGTIDSIFADGSVRRVGLKELWTLKWHKNFNTAGTYTRAGGMPSAEWPEWMQSFKEY